jgi:hypothetical protein
LFVFTTCPYRATCSAYLILLDYITVIIIGEEYRFWSSSVCISVLYHHSDILLDSVTLSGRSQNLSCCVSSLRWVTKFNIDQCFVKNALFIVPFYCYFWHCPLF